MLGRQEGGVACFLLSVCCQVSDQKKRLLVSRRFYGFKLLVQLGLTLHTHNFLNLGYMANCPNHAGQMGAAIHLNG